MGFEDLSQNYPVIHLVNSVKKRYCAISWAILIFFGGRDGNGEPPMWPVFLPSGPWRVRLEADVDSSVGKIYLTVERNKMVTSENDLSQIFVTWADAKQFLLHRHSGHQQSQNIQIFVINITREKKSCMIDINVQEIGIL